MKINLTLIFSIAAFFSYAQERTSSLSVSQIMQGEDFVGYLPQNIRWSADSRAVYFSWNPDKDTLRSLYQATLSDRTPQKLSLAEQIEIVTARGAYNDDRTLRTFQRNGDIFLLNVAEQSVRQVTNTIGRESDPSFSGDGQYVIYSHDADLYTWHITDGTLRQLTNFVNGKAPEDDDLPEYQQWLENDQLDMFRVLAQRKATRDLEENRTETLAPQRPLEIYTGEKEVSDASVSPDLRYVTYRLTQRAEDDRTNVPNYVTASGFEDGIGARSKVGAPQDTYELGIYDINQDTAYLIDPSQIPGIYDKPAYLEQYHTGDSAYSQQYDAPRDVFIQSPVYAQDGKAVAVVRSQDNKDRWFMRLNLEDGKLSLLDRQHDAAWIAGPGIAWYYRGEGNLGWIDDDNIWFQSEESGYSHLYSLNVNTGKKKALTEGEYEVTQVLLSQDKKTFYLITSRESPFERHVYEMSSRGGKLKKLTSQPGNYQAILSPDEAYWALRYSTSNEPWELYLMENKPGASMQQVTNSTTDDFEAYDWREPEVIHFGARDGVEVPARLYRPENPNGAGVVFVHGAGYLQNVHRWWSSYYREYMFHNMLTDLGYTVMDIDYRGSAGYGRDWRTAIYRHMSGKDLTDQIDGAQFMIEELGVDEGRLGIYGGSYGGFITIAALLKNPGVFQAGAALRSVTDWAHYNHVYTSNILNTPATDSLAYRRSSPIYFAEGLEDKLLMLHGMVDDNVHFQDVVRLTQRFIELGKENWDLAVFPLEPHGFREPSSWTDEYRRIFELFEEEIGEP